MSALSDNINNGLNVKTGCKSFYVSTPRRELSFLIKRDELLHFVENLDIACVLDANELYHKFVDYLVKCLGKRKKDCWVLVRNEGPNVIIVEVFTNKRISNFTVCFYL